MAPNQDDGSNPRITVTLPGNQKTALDYIASERSSPGNRTYTAEVAREYIQQGLANEDDMPEEARDLLDDDLISNGGGKN